MIPVGPQAYYCPRAIYAQLRRREARPRVAGLELTPGAALGRLIDAPARLSQDDAERMLGRSLKVHR